MQIEETKVKEKNPALQWVKEHKTEIVIASVTVTTAIVVTKNWGTLKELFKPGKIIVNEIKGNRYAETQVITPVISNEILANLSGNKLTARELGNKTGCTAQEINKRIVNSGLAIKLPCGDYLLTEIGRLVGESTLKTTRAGHSFSNNEFDEKIIDMLFSPEELRNIM